MLPYGARRVLSCAAPAMRLAAAPRRHASLVAARDSFAFAAPVSWFPGHMAKAARQIGEQFSGIDVVVEVRDARIPLSSANEALDHMLRGKRRVLVFNKADLSNGYLHKRIRDMYEQQGVQVVFTDAAKGHGMPRLIDAAVASSDSGYRVAGALVLVAGMPNVGKSSIINAIRSRANVRRKKTAKTGGEPGVTRHISAIQVSTTPPVYLLDTPGIMLPNVDDPHVGLKLALTGALPDNTVSDWVLADFLLFLLNRMGNTKYAAALELPNGEPSDDVSYVLRAVAERIGARGRGSAEWDEDVAARHVVRQFRTGALGRLTLDEIAA